MIELGTVEAGFGAPEGIQDAVRMTVASRLFGVVLERQPDLSYSQAITKAVSLTNAIEAELGVRK